MGSEIQSPFGPSKHMDTQICRVCNRARAGEGVLCSGGIGECERKSTTLRGEAEMDWGEERDCG